MEVGEEGGDGVTRALWVAGFLPTGGVLDAGVGGDVGCYVGVLPSPLKLQRCNMARKTSDNT